VFELTSADDVYSDVFVVKLDADGNLDRAFGARSFGSPNTEKIGTDIAHHGNAVFVAGYTVGANSTAFVRKLDAATGAEVWSRAPEHSAGTSTFISGHGPPPHARPTGEQRTGVNTGAGDCSAPALGESPGVERMHSVRPHSGSPLSTNGAQKKGADHRGVPRNFRRAFCNAWA
jgi:outer membrane protein assembly factor BamB